MFKKVMALMCALVVLVGGVFSTSFQSSASDIPTYYLPFAEPAKSDTQGYLILLWKDLSTNVLHPYVYFWNTQGNYNGGYEQHTYAYITLGSNSIEFVPAGKIGDNTSVYYSLVQIDEYGYYTWLKSSSNERFSQTYNGWQIVGWHYAGNVGYFNKTEYSYQFFCYFDDDGASALLNDILYTLSLSHNVDVDIFNKVNSILSSVDGLENQLSSVISYLQSIDSELDSIKSELQKIYNKADAIFNEQKETNDWLDKIYNYLKESPEKQKNEATQQGNNSVSQGTASIEDKGAGFVDSMGGLVSSMSYSGTDCAWTFPQVKLPAIDGVMEERVLIEEQPIDFTRWINAIPAPILLLIQSVLTMALIVYCFKELYGTISYVLTLRGGGSNE